MCAVSNFFKLFLTRRSLKMRTATAFISSKEQIRRFADTSKTDVNSKQVVTEVETNRVWEFGWILKVQGNENEERLRVRRARPADVPRVLRYVREHARLGWPGLVAPTSAPHLVLCDYVARALAQGHSMLAEQHEVRRGWTQLRGIALGTVVCSWDAAMLEKWARCVKCTHSKRLMHFTAHCLRAPQLHDKYRVHNILQVILIVPPDNIKSTDIIHMLVKNAIQRGRDAGFRLIRFDVTSDAIGKSLEELELKKEWQLLYDVLPETIQERLTANKPAQNKPTTKTSKTEDETEKAHYIAVYTAMTHGVK